MFHAHRTCRTQFAACTLLALVASAARAQSVYEPSVEPASFERTASATAPATSRLTVQFGRRAPQPGDQLEQTLSVTLKLATMVRQNNEVIEQTKTALHRRQRRVVTTTHVADGMTKAVLVRYAEAAKQLAAGPTADQLDAAKPSPQPVEGKTYRVRRDGETLLVNDEAGKIPPLDEYEIVALNMESLGRPNPLADYLAGQTVAVGQRLALPNAVAEKLLGLGQEMGQVSRFELKLQSIKPTNGVICAEFLANIEAESNDSSQMRLAVDGLLTIEVETCRAVAADFTGPIGMSETRGSLSATYQMIGTGNMTVRIASQYNDIRR